MMIAAIIKDHIELDMSHLVSSDTMLDRIDLHNERDRDIERDCERIVAHTSISNQSSNLWLLGGLFWSLAEHLMVERLRTTQRDICARV